MRAALISTQIPHTRCRLVPQAEKRLFNVNTWEKNQVSSNSTVNKLGHATSKSIFKQIIKSFPTPAESTAAAQLLGKLWADVRCHICVSAMERNALFSQKLMTQWELGVMKLVGRCCLRLPRLTLWMRKGVNTARSCISDEVLSITSENINDWSKIETEAKVCRTANADWVNEPKRRKNVIKKIFHKHTHTDTHIQIHTHMRTHTYAHRDKPRYCILTSGAEQGHIRKIEPPAECNQRGWTKISSLLSHNSLITSSRCVCLCVFTLPFGWLLWF